MGMGIGLTDVVVLVYGFLGLLLFPTCPHRWGQCPLLFGWWCPFHCFLRGISQFETIESSTTEFNNFHVVTWHADLTCEHDSIRVSEFVVSHVVFLSPVVPYVPVGFTLEEVPTMVIFELCWRALYRIFFHRLVLTCLGSTRHSSWNQIRWVCFSPFPSFIPSPKNDSRSIQST